MKCPIELCNKMFKEIGEISKHTSDCLKNSKFSKTHILCILNPFHVVRKEDLLKHTLTCTNSKDKLHEESQYEEHRKYNKPKLKTYNNMSNDTYYANNNPYSSQ